MSKRSCNRSWICQCRRSWSSATLGQASGDSTGGRALVGKQIVDGPVPQIQEKIVEVVKVILREQCQRVLFFLLTACGTAHSHTRELAYFDSVWEGSCGLHAKTVCCPAAHPLKRGLILSASDGIWNMLFSTYSQMVSSSVESVSLVVAQASAICSNCLHRLPNCLLSVMIMCTAVSEEAAASDILVGAQPRIRCWLVRGPRAAIWWTQPQRDGSSEWKMPRVWSQGIAPMLLVKASEVGHVSPRRSRRSKQNRTKPD